MSENNNKEMIINQQDLMEFPLITNDIENNININENGISKNNYIREILEKRINGIEMSEKGFKLKDIASKLNVTVGSLKKTFTKNNFIN